MHISGRRGRSVSLFRVAGFIVVRPVCLQGRWIHWGTSSDSSSVAWFIMSTPCGTLGSSVNIGVRVGGRCVHTVPLVSALGVVGFVRSVSQFVFLLQIKIRYWVGVAWIIGVGNVVNCVHWGGYWGTTGALSSLWLILEFVPGRWVHTGGNMGSLRSLGFSLGVVGFFQSRWVHWGAPWGIVEYVGWVRP